MGSGHDALRFLVGDHPGDGSEASQGSVVWGDRGSDGPQGLRPTPVEYGCDCPVEGDFVSTHSLGPPRNLGGAPKEPEQSHLLDVANLVGWAAEAKSDLGRHQTRSDPMTHRLARHCVCRQRQRSEQLDEPKPTGSGHDPTKLPQLAASLAGVRGSGGGR